MIRRGNGMNMAPIWRLRLQRQGSPAWRRGHRLQLQTSLVSATDPWRETRGSDCCSHYSCSRSPIEMHTTPEAPTQNEADTAMIFQRGRQVGVLTDEACGKDGGSGASGCDRVAEERGKGQDRIDKRLDLLDEVDHRLQQRRQHRGLPTAPPTCQWPGACAQVLAGASPLPQITTGLPVSLRSKMKAARKVGGRATMRETMERNIKRLLNHDSDSVPWMYASEAVITHCPGGPHISHHTRIATHHSHCTCKRRHLDAE